MALSALRCVAVRTERTVTTSVDSVRVGRASSDRAVNSVSAHTSSLAAFGFDVLSASWAVTGSSVELKMDFILYVIVLTLLCGFYVVLI